MSSGLSRCNRSNEGSRVQLTSFTSVHKLNSEKVDPTAKQECAKIIFDLNQETAQYCNLLVYVGGTHDSDDLREELKKIRSRTFELAKLNKLKLIPLLRNTKLSTDDQKELERMYNMYSACLELLEIQFIKTLALQRSFPLHCGEKILIHTGLRSPSIRTKATVTVESLDSSGHERKDIEVDELKALERDVSDLNELLYDINQTIAVQPWEIEADIETTDHKNDISGSVHSGSSSRSSLDITNTDMSDNKRRRCMCIVVLTFTALVISASVIGICLGLIQ